MFWLIYHQPRGCAIYTAGEGEVYLLLEHELSSTEKQPCSLILICLLLEGEALNRKDTARLLVDL